MSKVRLPLVLSLSFHLVLLLGIFSITGLAGHDRQNFIVELVSSRTPEFSGLGGDPSPPAMPLPVRADPPASSGKSASRSEEAVLDAGIPFRGEEEKERAPVQSEPESSLPEEPAASPDPVLSFDRIEEAVAEERPRAEPFFGLVPEGGASGGSDGKSSGGGAGAGENPVGTGTAGTGSGRGFAGIAEGGGGGGSAPGFVMPSLAGRSNPKPRYPEGARAEGREGTALVKVTVLPDGKAGETSIDRSSGHADLDRSAVEAVAKWKFLPARRGEEPVPASVRIPVTFALDDP